MAYERHINGFPKPFISLSYGRYTGLSYKEAITKKYRDDTVIINDTNCEDFRL